MRKKIQDLAYGRFQYEKPIPEFSKEWLEFEILQEENYKGSFTITSTNGVPMRGIVYSSNSRMECLTPQFEGVDVTIQFEFHSEGLVEGDVQKGDFYIICNDGEYNLSFAGAVTKYYPNTSIGRIKNLFDFANLAQVSFSEAYSIFQASYFENFIKNSETKERMLYRALGGNAFKQTKIFYQNLEEFLIGIRKKKRVSFQLEEKEKQYNRITENYKETLDIKKDRWGYIRIEIKADEDFIIPVKKELTTDDFTGNQAKLEFVIAAERLHGGNNFGRIYLESPYHREFCDICIHNSDTKRNHAVKKWKAEITELYIKVRMKRVTTGIWSRDTCDRLDMLLEDEPKNRWNLLFKAQALLVNKQRQEAEWILDGLKRDYSASNPPQKDTPHYAFYLYLCTLYEREPSYVTKVTKQIQDIYHEHQDNFILFWVMLFVNEELNNSKSRKLQAIEQQIENGAISPVLYMEAYYIISRDVYLLKKAGVFERQMLYWAVKNKAITKEVTLQIINLMPQVRQFHLVWYRILKACYEINAEKDILQALCSYCIKWNCYGEKYFPWYHMGIKKELRITGLYEAWMLSAKRGEIERLPKTVAMYFQYQNNLDYRRQALLYAAVIKSRESQRSLYSNYQKVIDQFAVEQLLAGRIDENLAVIYEHVLEDSVINEEIANALANILYTHKITCRDEKAIRVVVVHSQLKEEQVVSLINQQAYIQLYTGSYCILLEDAHGVRYMSDSSMESMAMDSISKDIMDMDIMAMDSITMDNMTMDNKGKDSMAMGSMAMDRMHGMELERLMQPGHYLKRCLKSSGEKLPYLIHYFDGRRTWQTFQKEDAIRLMFLMASEAVSKSYKEELRPQIIEYYYNSYSGEELDHYLSQVDYMGLERTARSQLMELMISRGILGRAYEMILAFGCEQAAIGKLLLVADQQIEKKSCEEDKSLTGLCHDIYSRGKYNETVLKYLCRYFKGTIKELEQLWKAARKFGLEVTSLEERFLIQVLYTNGYTKNMSDIFECYYMGGGKEIIVLAYLSAVSYQYFVKGVVAPDNFFRCIGRQMELGNELNDSCRLAYLDWLTRQKSLSNRQRACFYELTEMYVMRGMRFSFFHNLPQELLRKYHLYDKTFLEYRTNPAHRVVICYGISKGQSEETFLEEEMVSVYEGIFVKEFIVFFGEEIPYYIKEESEEGTAITESGLIGSGDSNSDTFFTVVQGKESRYDLINGMMISAELNDWQTLPQLIEQYKKMEYAVEQVFKLQ